MLPIPQMLQKCVGVLTGSLSCEKRNEQGGWELSEFPEHCSCSPAGTSYSSLDLTLSATAWKTRTCCPMGFYTDVKTQNALFGCAPPASDASMSESCQSL